MRDAQATGLSYGLFDYMQLIEMLTIVEDEKGLPTLDVEENGIASCEALLLARHFMQRRVYQYPSIKAYSFHMARFMQMHYKDPKYFSDVERYITMNEPDVLCAMQKAHKDSSHPGHMDALAFMDREKRFQAIDLQPSVASTCLQSYKEKFCIPDEKIYWDIKHAMHTSDPHKQIPQKAFSAIAIPKVKKNWLYLAPEYDFSL